MAGAVFTMQMPLGVTSSTVWLDAIVKFTSEQLCILARSNAIHNIFLPLTVTISDTILLSQKTSDILYD